MRRTLALAGGIGLLLLAAGVAQAQMEPLIEDPVGFALDSGWVVNDGRERGVIFSALVSQPGRPWLRLTFDAVELGPARIGDEATILRMTSLKDGAEQRMNARHLEEWDYSSAFFNGDMVLLEIVASPGAQPSRVAMNQLLAGGVNMTASICGPTDDRLPSDDPRAGRYWNAGCTAWLIDDTNHCFITAGHCTFSSQIVEFNVPFSNSNGSVNFSHPDDQYAVDGTSMQTNGGQGIGNDYAYFGCFENSNTGLTPAEAQGDWYIVADEAPPAGGNQEIRITGYGTTGGGVPREWNQIQKTHLGPYVLMQGTTVGYQTDTSGGNSGSPVIHEQLGMAIGVHTHAGCNSGGGQNHGTAIHHPGFQNYLNNPQGLCIPNVPATIEPNQMAATFGVLQSGSLGDLRDSDNSYVVVRQRSAVSPTLPAARLEVQGEAPYGAVSLLEVTLEAAATAVPANVPQTLEGFDFAAGQFVELDSRTATSSDSVVQVGVPGNPSDFVQNGTRRVYARASWFDPGLVLFVNWNARIDEFTWYVEPTE